MKPSWRMRMVFAILGAIAGVLSAVILEGLFALAGTSRKANISSTPSLLFVNDFSRRLTREGGRSGDIRATLVWNNRNDLDLWCVDPNGERIFFAHPRSRSGGELDVDMNVRPPALSTEPVENIYWPAGGAPNGPYRFYVHHYRNHGESDPTSYQVEIENHGRIQRFSGSVTHGQAAVLVAEIRASRLGLPTWRLPHGFWHAVAATALWTGMLALALFGVIFAGLRHFLRRPPIPREKVLREATRATACGLAAGAAGQAFCGALWAVLPFLPSALDKLFGWLVLGGLLGYLFSRCFQAWMPRGLAFRCGLVGSAMAWLAFGLVMVYGDSLSRIGAAKLLGLAIGWSVSLAWRGKPPDEVVRERGDALEPVSLQAYRVGPTGTLRGR